LPTASNTRPPTDYRGLVIRFQREYVCELAALSLMDQPTVNIRSVRRLCREGVTALSITTSNIDEVIVVHLSGAICFSEESASLRIRVKALLENSAKSCWISRVSLASIAAALELLWLYTRQPGRSAVTSSLPTQVITQKRRCKLQGSLRCLRYSADRRRGCIFQQSHSKNVIVANGKLLLLVLLESFTTVRSVGARSHERVANPAQRSRGLVR
jgi:hypothetical protein